MKPFSWHLYFVKPCLHQFVTEQQRGKGGRGLFANCLLSGNQLTIMCISEKCYRQKQEMLLKEQLATVLLGKTGNQMHQTCFLAEVYNSVKADTTKNLLYTILNARIRWESRIQQHLPLPSTVSNGQLKQPNSSKQAQVFLL